MRKLLAVLLCAPVLALAAQYREIPLNAGVARTVTTTEAAVDTRAYEGTYESDGVRVFVSCPTVSGAGANMVPSLIGVVGGVSYNLGSGAAITVSGGTSTFSVSDAPGVLAILFTITGTTPSFTCNASVMRY